MWSHPVFVYRGGGREVAAYNPADILQQARDVRAASDSMMPTVCLAHRRSSSILSLTTGGASPRFCTRLPPPIEVGRGPLGGEGGGGHWRGGSGRGDGGGVGRSVSGGGPGGASWGGGASIGQVWTRHLAPAAPASRPSSPTQFHECSCHADSALHFCPFPPPWMG